MARAVVDTGPLVALVRRREAWHGRCVAVVQTLAAPLLTSWTVLTEAAWLLRQDPRGMEALEAMFRSGELEVVSLDRDALTWVFDFMRKCRSAGAQLADATVIHIAERMGIDFVFTLDLRDFSIYPFADGRAPSIIPKP